MNNLTLRKGLIELGISTQKEMAEVMGVSNATVSGWMSVDMSEAQQNEILDKIKEALK